MKYRKTRWGALDYFRYIFLAFEQPTQFDFDFKVIKTTNGKSIYYSIDFGYALLICLYYQFDIIAKTLQIISLLIF